MTHSQFRIRTFIGFMVIATIAVIFSREPQKCSTTLPLEKVSKEPVEKIGYVKGIVGDTALYIAYDKHRYEPVAITSLAKYRLNKKDSISFRTMKKLAFTLTGIEASNIKEISP